MIKNYLLITLRSMKKNKAFIFINVFGMGIAIACNIVGYLAFKYDATFDGIHEKGENIYRISAVRTFENNLTRFGYVPLPLGNITDKTISDVELSSRYNQSQSNFKRDADLFSSNLSYVDPDFFQMFTFEFIEGDPESIKDNTSVAISESMAIRLFGTANEAFEKNITQVYGNELKELKITGVFRDQPRNSSFFHPNGSAFMNFDNYKDEFAEVREDDWTAESTLFVTINNGTRITSVHKQLQSYLDANNKARPDFQIKEFTVNQFASMAKEDRATDARVRTNPAPPKSAILGAITVGVPILLIACFNLTNTAIAVSSRRLKEIGIRKVMGSKRKQLILQFIGETTFICLLGLVVALLLTRPLVAGWNLATDNNIYLTTEYVDPGFAAFLCVILLFTGIIAGSYPAFYITKFQPVAILKDKLKLKGTNFFTRTLLGAQFVISLVAITCSIAYVQNARYQEQYDLGFDIRGSIISWLDNENEFSQYSNIIEQNPDVLSTAGARGGIFSNTLHRPVKFESREVEVDIIEVGDNYLKTMGLELLQGRDFIEDSKTDENESIIISQNMASVFGWEHSIGKEIILGDSVKLVVVGVVKVVYTQGLWREMDPLMIRYILPEKYNQIVVSTEAEDVAAVNDDMKRKWSNLFPNRLYTGKMLISSLKEVVDLNKSIVQVYAFLAVIAMLLSATGLYSLVSLNLIRRMKEIGVRKVLGASLFHIYRIVNMEFLIILIIASAVGSWLSFNLTHTVMSSIWKYYQGINAATFATAITTMLAVLVLAIGYKVFTVANMNPVKTLRDE